MQLQYKIPSDLTKPVDEKTPNPAQATPSYDSGYMDGTCNGYEGANTGRDQDRSRVDERVAASYNYTSGPSGAVNENETGVTEGF